MPYLSTSFNIALHGYLWEIILAFFLGASCYALMHYWSIDYPRAYRDSLRRRSRLSRRPASVASIQPDHLYSRASHTSPFLYHSSTYVPPTLAAVQSPFQETFPLPNHTQWLLHPNTDQEYAGHIGPCDESMTTLQYPDYSDDRLILTTSQRELVLPFSPRLPTNQLRLDFGCHLDSHETPAPPSHSTRPSDNESYDINGYANIGEYIFTKGLPLPRCHGFPAHAGVTIIEDGASISIKIRGKSPDLSSFVRKIEGLCERSIMSGTALDLSIQLMFGEWDMDAGFSILGSIIMLTSQRIGKLSIIVPDLSLLAPGSHPVDLVYHQAVDFPMLESFTWNGNVQNDFPSPWRSLSKLSFDRLTVISLYCDLSIDDCIEILYRCQNIVEFTANTLRSHRPVMEHTFSPFDWNKSMDHLLASKVVGNCFSG